MILVALGVVAVALIARLVKPVVVAAPSSDSRVAGHSQPTRSSAGYWVLAAALIVFGILTGFTIGIPFLVLGVSLVVIGSFHGRPVVR